MKSIAQAWNLLRDRKVAWLLLGVIGAIVFWGCLMSPGSPFIFAVCFTLLMEMAIFIHQRKNFSSFKLRLKTNALRLLTLMILLIPAGVLLGSALGFLQSPYGLYLSLSMTMMLLTITFYFFFVFSQSQMVDPQSLSMAKSLDLLFLASLKNIGEVAGLCLTAAFLVILSVYTKGIGLVITIPLLALANLICYEKFMASHLRPGFRKPANADSKAADVQSP